MPNWPPPSPPSKSSWPSCCASQYVAGNEDRMKLCCRATTRTASTATCNYFGYVSQAQATLLESLRGNLQAVESNQADTQQRQGRAGRNRPGTARPESRAGRGKSPARRPAGATVQQTGQPAQGGRPILRDEQRLGQPGRPAVADDRGTKEGRGGGAGKAPPGTAGEGARRPRKGARRQPRPRKASGSPAPPPTRTRSTTTKPPAPALARNELTPEAGDPIRTRLRRPARAFAAAGGRRRDRQNSAASRGDGPSWKGLFIRAAEGADGQDGGRRPGGVRRMAARLWQSDHHRPRQPVPDDLRQQSVHC